MLFDNCLKTFDVNSFQKPAPGPPSATGNFHHRPRSSLEAPLLMFPVPIHRKRTLQLRAA